MSPDCLARNSPESSPAIAHMYQRTQNGNDPIYDRRQLNPRSTPKVILAQVGPIDPSEASAPSDAATCPARAERNSKGEAGCAHRKGSGAHSREARS